MAVVCTFDSTGPKFVQGGWGRCIRQPCEWTPWKPWSECSRTCGGGTKSRSRSFCCRNSFENVNDGCVRDCGKNPDGFHEQSDCNDWCYNGGWVSSNGCRKSVTATQTTVGTGHTSMREPLGLHETHNKSVTKERRVLTEITTLASQAYENVELNISNSTFKETNRQRPNKKDTSKCLKSTIHSGLHFFFFSVVWDDFLSWNNSKPTC
ncbi:hypothetical protein MAR_034339 [Mya arenaria]|uniref:Uncharacterized protein n=1 Tax=Mya arenaria TaxID=6604 RepID=A0ABY7GEL5_MYAAR|nr:hypothetical protein MAR_034339 [Mya arenaria]